MRTIYVVTAGRSDFGIYKPVLERIDVEPSLRYELVVTGAHLSGGQLDTASEIAAGSYPVAATISVADTGGSQSAVTDAMAAILGGAGRFFARKRPDLLLVLGDRFEMFSVTAAAVPFNIPIAHIHGGELSYGAIDEVFRHAITKMAHLHFPAAKPYADRLERMGEEPWRVTVSGAPALDTIKKMILPSKSELAARFSIPLDEPPILVTFHPTTRQAGDEARQIAELLGALAAFPRPIVFTAPNADSGSNAVRAQIEAFVAAHPNAYLVESFGALNYLAMLREAAVVVGNSSSGLLETPSFEVPTVNVGDRQQGRLRARNVIDVSVASEEIQAAISTALDPQFRESLRGMANPFGDGEAAERIVSVLRDVPIDARLVNKRFHDSGER